MTRPHIVLLVADDQRFDTIAHLADQPGFADAAGYRTPRLDALAQRGTAWSRVRIPGSTHGAVCAPSRAMLHTGRWLWNTSDGMCRLEGEPTLARRGDGDRPLPTLGSRLSDAGYRTHASGKWHNGEDALRRGFHSASAMMMGGMCSPFGGTGLQGYEAPGEPMTTRGPGQHVVDLFTDGAVEAIQQTRSDSRPLFLYVAFTLPHDPKHTHWRYHKRFDAADVQMPPSFQPQHPEPQGLYGGRDENIAEYPRDPEEIRHHIADYRACVLHLDDCLGRIEDALKEAGIFDDTLLGYTADHGICIGRHGLMGKQSLYDDAVRVPLVLAGPGLEAGRVDDTPRMMQDLHPTLLAAAGVDEPTDFRRLDESAGDEPQYLCYSDSHRAVCEPTGLKLIEYTRPKHRHTELFDLAADPYETRNLADERPDDVTRLRGLMRQHHDATGDPTALPF
jgi:arylsulfatase A-like enzyme